MGAGNKCLRRVHLSSAKFGRNLDRVPRCFFGPRQQSFRTHELTIPGKLPPRSGRNMEDRYLSDGLRGLYQDLSSLSSQPLQNVDRLCLELETQIEDFKRLLDKPTKNNASRQAVLSGKSTCTSILKSGMLSPPFCKYVALTCSDAV